VATTNSGGSNGWLDAYGDSSLAGCYRFPDKIRQERSGRHVVFSIKDKANSVKVIHALGDQRYHRLLMVSRGSMENLIETLIKKTPYASSRCLL